MLGNELRLKRDLGQLGVFDERMSLYLLYKLRAQSMMGFSGFEGRHYSLFSNHLDDFGEAAALQALVNALAFRYIASGTVRHEDIPDDPFTESERRQCLFASAMGVGTVNVRAEGPNRFLTRVLGKTQKTRASRRYAGQLRVRCNDYRLALVATLEEDAADLIESFQLQNGIRQLRERLSDAEHCSTAGKLTRGIVDFAGARNPYALSGEEFARAAEGYYRMELRSQYVREALGCVQEDLQAIEQARCDQDRPYRGLVTAVIGSRSPVDVIAQAQPDLLKETADAETLRHCIGLCLATIARARATGHHMGDQSLAS